MTRGILNESWMEYSELDGQINSRLMLNRICLFL